MSGIIELSIGIVIALVTIVIGVVFIAGIPSGKNFTKWQIIRYLTFTIIGAIAGAALITFGILALL